MKTSITALAFGLLALAVAPAHALDAPKVYRSEYTVSFLGLPVAHSNFVTIINGNAFTLKGSLKSAGVGAFFDSTVANTAVSGTLTEAGAMPGSYTMYYVSGKKRSKAFLEFDGGNVVRQQVLPVLRPGKPRPTFVPLRPEHMKRVADPFTSAVVKSDSLEGVCARTLNVYDGKMRLDLRLSNPVIGKGKAEGFDGPTVTCKAKFIPVAGYRKDQKSIRFLAGSDGISITFAQNGDSGIYGPLRAQIQTYVGPLVIQATRFGVTR